MAKRQVFTVIAPVLAGLLLCASVPNIFGDRVRQRPTQNVENLVLDLSKVPPDQDVGLNMMELVAARGYAIESHAVTTKDGYILTMFRIPAVNSTHSPVILQHGLLDSSYTWINNFEDESLGFILSDAGYDVWFGNNRGNRYGRGHTTLDPDNKESGFWDFTWDEMAFSDAPAMINYVKSATSSKKVSWVGHSEGTIQIFAAGSSVATSKDADFIQAIQSIDLFVALAPVAYTYNVRSKLMQILADSRIPEILYNRGYIEFFPGMTNEAAPEVCQAAENACNFFLMTICGPTQNINASRIQVYVSQTPAGTSTRNMMHWQQGMQVDLFQMYDYGSEAANKKHYGSATPPLYDLTSMTIPTALFYGDNDYLADVTDVNRLLRELPTDTVVFSKESPGFAHLDYTWAVNANTEVYADVVNLLNGRGRKP